MLTHLYDLEDMEDDSPSHRSRIYFLNEHNNDSIYRGYLKFMLGPKGGSHFRKMGMFYYEVLRDIPVIEKKTGIYPEEILRIVYK